MKRPSKEGIKAGHPGGTRTVGAGARPRHLWAPGRRADPVARQGQILVADDGTGHQKLGPLMRVQTEKVIVESTSGVHARPAVVAVGSARDGPPGHEARFQRREQVPTGGSG